MSNDNVPMLIIGMVRIVEINIERVIEDGFGFVKIYEQNPLVTSGDRFRRQSIFLSRRALQSGQIHMKCGSLARLAIDCDRSLMACHDSVDCGQTHAGAFVNSLGREKGLKNAFQGRTVHAVACVADGKPQVSPLLQIYADSARKIGIYIYNIQAHPQHASPLPHGVIGVGAQIHYHLVHLGRISQDGPAVRIDVLADLDGRRQRCPQQFKGLLDDEMNLHRLVFMLNLTDILLIPPSLN